MPLFYALCANKKKTRGCFLHTRFISFTWVVTVSPWLDHLSLVCKQSGYSAWWGNGRSVSKMYPTSSTFKVSYHGICEIWTWPLFQDRVSCSWITWLFEFFHLMSCFQYFVILKISQVCRCQVTWLNSIQAPVHGRIGLRDFCATDYVIPIVPLFCQYRQVNRNFPDFTRFSAQVTWYSRFQRCVGYVVQDDVICQHSIRP